MKKENTVILGEVKIILLYLRFSSFANRACYKVSLYTTYLCVSCKINSYQYHQVKLTWIVYS